MRNSLLRRFRSPFALPSTLPAAVLALALVLLPGCGDSPSHSHAHAEKSGHAGHAHEHTPPHGGTPIVLGNEQFHVELVRDPAAGTLTAYTLDAHMESFVRIAAPEFTAKIKTAAGEQSLTFKAVANAATGEKVGDTAMFIAQADWLKTTDRFEGEIVDVSLRGVRFEHVAFKFPEGNEPGR